MAIWAALALLSIFPSSSLADNAISITYTNRSIAAANNTTRILLTTTYYETGFVLLNISMTAPKIYVYFGLQTCDPDEAYCAYWINFGYSYLMNLGGSYHMTIRQQTRNDLDVFINGCEQDFSKYCRSESTSLENVCICNGKYNFCTDSPRDMWSSPDCSDAPIPTLPTQTTAFNMFVFYGLSNPGDLVAQIFRLTNNKNQIMFRIECSPEVEITINSAQKCNQNLIYIITEGEVLTFDVGADPYTFSFSLIQRSFDETDVAYQGCPREKFTSCRDTSAGTAPYGCLCPGEKGVCEQATVLDNQCSEGTVATTSTQKTTTASAETSFLLNAFYGYSGSPTEAVVRIERIAFSPQGATFNISQLSSIPFEVDGSQCYSYCLHVVSAFTRIDILVNNVFHFYLFEYPQNTTVGIGNESCPQDISKTCKSGPLLEDSLIYGCLCENDSSCQNPKNFDLCETTTSSTATTAVTTKSSTSLTTSSAASTTTTSRTTTAVNSTEDPGNEVETTTNNRIQTTTSAIPTLADLSNSTIGQNNVTTILNDTLTYSQNQGDLTEDQVDQIAVILTKSANVSGLNETDSTLILLNMDNCLFASDASVSEKASQQMLSLLPIMVQNTVSPSIDYLQGTNMGFSARQVNCSDYGSDHGLMDEVSMFVYINGTPSSKRNAIQIPLSSVCSEIDVSHVFFSLYRDRKLFKGPKQYRTYNNHVYEENKETSQKTTNGRQKRAAEEEMAPSPCEHQNSLATDSPVMSGTLLNGDGGGNTRRKRMTESNKPMAQLQFNVEGLLAPLHGHFVVTWWDGDSGEWATEDRCETERKGDMVVATCNHLTDFTLIVDASLNDPCVCDTALIATGYVVNGLSIASLAFLFIVYICAFIPRVAETKVIRYVNGYATAKKDSISLSYTTSLLLFYLTFAIFSSQEVSGNACTTMGAICYALFISTIVMNIFKCIRMTLHLLPAPTRNFFQFMQRALVFDTISIIVPFVISILLLLLTDFFNRNDAFCWVRVDYVVFATVVPISILLVNALITSSLVAYRLFSTNMRVKKRGKHIDYNLGAKLLNLLVLQVTLGMPWLLQYFTLAMPKATAWHYAFTIVLGSQGTLLVLLFFYKRQRILRSSRHAKKISSMQTQATEVSDGSSRSN